MSATPPGPPGTFSGTLHILVAFDWGDEVDLAMLRTLRDSMAHPLARRRRTPSSFEYRPLPVHLSLPAVMLNLPELGATPALATVTAFDFAGISVTLRLPFVLDAGALTRLAGYLADPEDVVRTVRRTVESLFEQMRPGIQDAHFSQLSEEYFVFQLPPNVPLPPATLMQQHAAWLAGLVRLEAGPLSEEEIAEALRRNLSYSPNDLVVADWAGAVVLDQDCDETLQVIEFANLQLLEYRHIDNRLDDNLATAAALIRPKPRRFWLPFAHPHAHALNVLGELKVEANGLFERTGNALKLVGDQYLARLYRMLAQRFHLSQWEGSIQRKLEVLEGIYEVLSDQAATFRGEAMELIVIVLIMLEIVVALWGH